MKVSAPELLNSKKVASALYKPKWVCISLKIDDYSRFTEQFLFPWILQLKSEIDFQFHFRRAHDFWTGITLSDTIQLHFCITHFNFEKKLKTSLFNNLNDYFQNSYFTSVGITRLDDNVLENKQGLDGFDIKRLRVMGIDEYHVDPMALLIGKHGVSILYELYIPYSDWMIHKKSPFLHLPDASESMQQAMLSTLPVLHTFFKNTVEMFHFLAWVVNKNLIQIHKITGVVDLYDWKFNLMRSTENFCKEQGDTFIEYTQILIDALENKEAFEEEWMNEWTGLLEICFQKSMTLYQEKKWPVLPYNYRYDSSLFREIDEFSYRKYFIVYNILKSINSLSGLDFHQELNLYAALKNALKMIHENAVYQI